MCQSTPNQSGRSRAVPEITLSPPSTGSLRHTAALSTGTKKIDLAGPATEHDLQVFTVSLQPWASFCLGHQPSSHNDRH